MRRLGVLLLLLALAAPAWAGTGDPPVSDDTSIPWYRWLFLGERAKPAEKSTAVAKDSKAPAKPAAAAGKEPAARTLADEQRVFLERLMAIDKIRHIAEKQGDEELLKKTYQLEEQADEVFKQRTAQLPSGGSDRAILERGRDDRPATAERPAPRRRTTRGDDR